MVCFEEPSNKMNQIQLSRTTAIDFFRFSTQGDGNARTDVNIFGASRGCFDFGFGWAA